MVVKQAVLLYCCISPSQDTSYRSIMIPVGLGFCNLGRAMVRKAETVPWVRTGNITMAEEIINLQRLASF